MSLPRVSLLLAALGSGGFGIAFLVTPEKLIRQVDLALVGPGGLSEIWAMYGGLELGLAGFFIACAVRQLVACRFHAERAGHTGAANVDRMHAQLRDQPEQFGSANRTVHRSLSNVPRLLKSPV